jgi:nitrogen fixation protein NifU and related proteins
MSNQYSKAVINRFLNPTHMGEIKKADAIGEVGNTKCGDVMKVYLKISKNKQGQERVEDIKFQTLGCVAAIASTDTVCELAKGKTLKDAQKITKKEILSKLKGLPKIKTHCSLLGEEAIKKAIKDYNSKK